MGSFYGEMVKVPDCGLELSKFELQSRYYVHFRTNAQAKRMNPIISSAMGYIVTLLLFSSIDLALDNPGRLVWH